MHREHARGDRKPSDFLLQDLYYTRSFLHVRLHTRRRQKTYVCADISSGFAAYV